MLKELVDWLTFTLFKLNPELALSGAINFFIYDTVKIFLLLLVMVSLAGFLRTFLSRQKVKRILSGKGVAANIAASFFGAITPFCSCSSIPIFFGFVEAGVPLGVVFSFLITSPLINEYLAILMLGFFGLKITALYILSGITLGVVCGGLIGRLQLDRFLVRDLFDRGDETEPVFMGMRQRMLFGIKEAFSIIKRLGFYILAGVGAGAVIHNFVPQQIVQNAINKTGIFSVPIAVIIGVPMYGSCAAIVPVAVALFQKGIPIGTVLAFTMAVSALSLPEAILLRRAMKIQLILIFFTLTACGIIFTGYLFNFLAGRFF